MLFWVFDLDNTLYQLPRNTEFHYKYLDNDYQLKYSLSLLPMKKILYTNGTIGHADMCLKILDIENYFYKRICREDMNYIMKPHIKSFMIFIKKNKIMKNDKVVFFEDSVENLITAKNSFGWITVLIHPNHIMIPEIDFWFPNIHIALNFFNSKIMNHMKNIKKL
tara:strand:- start:151 stop:645 length:495 start_codon:yes stop_codon:yes gene_type:complete